MTQKEDESKAYLPELLYTGEQFERGLALVCDRVGRITRLAREDEISCEMIHLTGRAMLPGMVNSHSHAFQRVIRGRTEHRSKESKVKQILLIHPSIFCPHIIKFYFRCFLIFV